MNSVTQQDWTSLGADLQQELRQQWIPSQPLQVKCAVRDGALLVLAEHLLHVEPNPGDTFASLEQEIRRLVPELLKLQKTAASQAPAELPVQLFLRIAGYQQPYNSHKFQLDLRRSPIAEPPTQRFASLVGPTVKPSPMPTVASPIVEAEEDVTPNTPTDPIAADEPILEALLESPLESPEAVFATEPVVPTIEPTPATISTVSLIDEARLTDDRLESPTIETPETEAIEVETEAEALTEPIETVTEPTANEPEAIASSSDTIPAEVATPEPLTFEDLFSGEPAEEPTAVEPTPPESSIDRPTETPEATSDLTPVDIVAEDTVTAAAIPTETAESAVLSAEAVVEAAAAAETTEGAEPSFISEAPLESIEPSLAVTEPTDLQEEAQTDRSTLDVIDPLQTSAIETSAIEATVAPEPVELSEPVELIELPEPTEPIESIEPIEPSQPVEIVDTIAAIETAEQSEAVDLVETAEVEPVELVETVESASPVESIEPTETIETTEPLEFVEPIEAIEQLEPSEFVEPAEIAEEVDAIASIELSEPIEPITPIELSEPIESVAAPEAIETSQEIAAATPIEELAESETTSSPLDQVAQVAPAIDAIPAESPITAELTEQEPVEQETLPHPENDVSPQVDPLADLNLTGTIWPEPELQEPELQEPELQEPELQEPELQDLDFVDPTDRDLQVDADWTATETSPDLLEAVETPAEIPEISELPEMPGVIDLEEHDADHPLEQSIEPQLGSSFSPTVLPDPWAAELSTIEHELIEHELAEPSLEQPDASVHPDPVLPDLSDDADLQIDAEDLLSEDLLPEDSIELDNLETIGGLTEEQTVWAESDGLPEDGPEIDSIETTESLTEEQTIWAESDSLPEDSVETDSIETLSMSEDLMAAALVEEQAETLADIQPSSPPLPPNAAPPDAGRSSSLLPQATIDRPKPATTPVDATAPKTRRPFRWSASSVTLVGAIGAFVAVGGGYLLTRPCVIGGCEPLRKAQQLSQEAIETASTTDSALEVSDAYKKLNEANYLLSTIPSWSRYRQEAETLLNSYEDQASMLSQVVEALEQANQAAQKSQNPPHPLQEWREIQWLWREAIARLEKIPPTNPLYDLAQRKLQEYQTNLTGINQRVAIEQQAQDRITAARQIEQLGNARALAAKSPINWQETASTWTTAIEQLRQIPQGTMAYDEAQQLIAIYQPKLTEANLKRVQEQTAVDVYSQALNAAKQAQTMEQQSQWIQAATYWQNALSYAQQVPIESTYYNQIQTLIGSYRQSLQQAQQNSQRAVAIQAVKPSLDQACEGSPRLCTYTLSPQAIRVQFTAMYDKTVETLINKTQLEGGNSIPPAIVDQVNGMLRGLADVGEVTQVPIELYDSRGVKLGIYTPSLSGYVPQQ